MYAIIRDRGKQYRVKEGDVIQIDRLKKPRGEEVEFEVLYLKKGEEGEVGTPVIEGRKVKGKILGEVKGEKIKIIKFKRRKGYKRKQGHRQIYTQVKIVSIE